MAHTPTEDLLIGAHTSAAGGLHNALLQGKEIGATTIQLFTSNQRQWKAKDLTPQALEIWHETIRATGLKKIMSHDSYLINLGAPNPENLEKSQTCFRKEVERCVALDLAYLNFHPGSHLKEDPQACLDQIAKSLLEVEPLLEKSELRLLLETTAGQGSNLGWRFEELDYIIKKVEKQIPIGVCIDTCHIFAAGYDLRTADACEETLQEFDRIIGLQHLYAFHFNDSVGGLGSRKDRHKPIGEGEIGVEGFRFLMQDPRTRDLPKYLETPGGPEAWTQEIHQLREMAQK